MILINCLTSLIIIANFLGIKLKKYSVPLSTLISAFKFFNLTSISLFSFQLDVYVAPESFAVKIIDRLCFRLSLLKRLQIVGTPSGFHSNLLRLASNPEYSLVTNKILIITQDFLQIIYINYDSYLKNYQFYQTSLSILIFCQFEFIFIFSAIIVNHET